MLILGLLLLLVAGALTAGMVLGNTDHKTVELFGQSYSSFSVGELFIIGVATGIIAGLALTLVLSGMRRSGRKRRDRRAELKSKRTREQELQEENARLARELDQQRRSGASTSGTAASRPDTLIRLDGPSGADATGPAAKDSVESSGLAPTAGSSLGAGTGYGSPAGSPSQAPSSGPDISQEGRRPLS